MQPKHKVNALAIQAGESGLSPTRLLHHFIGSRTSSIIKLFLFDFFCGGKLLALIKKTPIARCSFFMLESLVGLSMSLLFHMASLKHEALVKFEGGYLQNCGDV